MMYEYLMNFAVAFVMVLIIGAATAAIIFAAFTLMAIYGPAALLVTVVLALATIAGIGFANDEKRKREAA